MMIHRSLLSSNGWYGLAVALSDDFILGFANDSNLTLNRTGNTRDLCNDALIGARYFV